MRRVVGLLALISASIPLIAPAQPKLVLPEGSRFDYGRVVAGSAPRHILRVDNEGTDTLRILNITVKCLCSTTRIITSAIAPGASGSIEVAFRSDFDRGAVEKNLSIISNDPGEKIHLVRFTAEVVSFLEVVPRVIVFSHEEARARAPKVISVANRDTAAVNLLSLVDSSFLVDAGGPAVRIAPGRSALVSCTPMPVGEETRDGTLELRFDHPQQPLVRVKYIIEGKRKIR